MDILRELKDKTVRWEMEEVKLFIPSIEQGEEIKAMIMSELQVDDLSKNTQLSSDITRYVLKELTSLGDTIDEYDDDDLIYIINKDRKLILLLREVSKLIKEYCDDIKYEVNQKNEELRDFLQSLIDMKNVEEMKEQMNEKLKENGINSSIDELIKMNEEKERLEKQLKEEQADKLVEKMTNDINEMTQMVDTVKNK